LEKMKEAVYWRERDRPDLALAAYRAAASLYRGDYLEEDRYEDWALSTREQLREAFFELRRDWTDLLAEQQRYAEALALCQHLLRDYPLREEIWQRVMRFYADSGQRDQALRAYEQCGAVLCRELETDPLPETQAVYEAILHEDLTPSPFPEGKGKLPSHFRRGDGGEVKTSPELQTLSDLLAATGLRTAVLTGPGSPQALEDFLAYARREGATVLRAQGDSLKSTLSFSVLLEVLRGGTAMRSQKSLALQDPTPFG
jgi:tetratricopeptide (TPR) repeat protein